MLAKEAWAVLTVLVPLAGLAGSECEVQEWDCRRLCVADPIAPFALLLGLRSDGECL